MEGFRTQKWEVGNVVSLPSVVLKVQDALRLKSYRVGPNMTLDLKPCALNPEPFEFGTVNPKAQTVNPEP